MSKITILDNIITEADSIRSKLPRQHYEDDAVWDEVHTDFCRRVPNWFKLIGHPIPDIQYSAMSNKYNRYCSFIAGYFSRLVEIKQQMKFLYERTLKEEAESKIRQEAEHKEYLKNQALMKKVEEYTNAQKIERIARARLENEKQEKLIIAKMAELRGTHN